MRRVQRMGRIRSAMTVTAVAALAGMLAAGCDAGSEESSPGASGGKADRKASEIRIDSTARKTRIVNGLSEDLGATRIIGDTGPKRTTISPGQSACWTGYTVLDAASICVDVGLRGEIVRVRSGVTLNSMTVNLPDRCEKGDGPTWSAGYTVPAKSALPILGALKDQVKVCLSRTSTTDLDVTFTTTSYYEQLLLPERWLC